MKVFNVFATKSEEYVVEVAANSYEEAEAIANEIEFGKWEKVEGGDDFHIYDTHFIREETNMDIKVFQTGRQYSEKGQRIAYLIDETCIYFVDVDRGLDGKLAYSTTARLPITNRDVLALYDMGNYKWFEIDEFPIREALRDKALHF
jgi:hypothetical protein